MMDRHPRSVSSFVFLLFSLHSINPLWEIWVAFSWIIQQQRKVTLPEHVMFSSLFNDSMGNINLLILPRQTRKCPYSSSISNCLGMFYVRDQKHMGLTCLLILIRWTRRSVQKKNPPDQNSRRQSTALSLDCMERCLFHNYLLFIIL